MRERPPAITKVTPYRRGLLSPAKGLSFGPTEGSKGRNLLLVRSSTNAPASKQRGSACDGVVLNTYLLAHNVSRSDTTTPSKITHDPPENRVCVGSYRVCFGAKHSRANSLSGRSTLAVGRSSAPRLGTDRCEYCPVRLRLMACILVHSWHHRPRARFYGGVVCGPPVLAA